MNDATARALNRINARFYRERAAEFSATRQAAWPGWHRLLELLESPDAGGLPDDARVLDLGCGNGRLGRFLAEKRPGLRYVGVDASSEMLGLARERGGLGTAPELLRLELVEDDLGATLGERRFDLATCCGLLHHLPGRARRAQTLALLLEHLAPGGRLAVTCWQLAQYARFRDRIVAWEAWNAAAPEPIDTDDLEPGDQLLPFGQAEGFGRAEGFAGAEGVRYVHFAHENETAELLAELPCRVVATFSADGRHGDANRYFVVEAIDAGALAGD